ncbi:MAG: PspC domain-containing protein [Bacteroidales bacterium]|jgi:phage shock protein C|nr:PspC domain-containing protein [Bacteroidales bacterium]MDD2203739.1 PspC domain-containing protein [Bacteroidales bacterium]MDD3152637.1 PspC domain-containing protein [Bacteroidales bacterium]MDD3913323.1 PspC domain-containing protein [Bacteroidales bacterium]MDD4633354.1 PspC domain-containing protein [Bacteroidales bacterium]
MSYKKLQRSRNNRVIAGVCGGLGEYFDIDPVIFRLIFAILFFAAGGGLLVYIILWIILPENKIAYNINKDEDKKPNYDRAASETPFEESSNTNVNEEDNKKKNTNGALIIGVAFILLGGMFLMQNLWGFFRIEDWWPLLLVAAGVVFMINAVNNKKE